MIAGVTADRKELTGDDQGTSNRDPDNSSLVGLSHGSSHDRHSTGQGLRCRESCTQRARKPIPDRACVKGVAGIYQVSPGMIASWKLNRGRTIFAAGVPTGRLRESARREVLQEPGSAWTL